VRIEFAEECLQDVATIVAVTVQEHIADSAGHNLVERNRGESRRSDRYDGFRRQSRQTFQKNTPCRGDSVSGVSTRAIDRMPWPL
jgi:hypothetical protein